MIEVTVRSVSGFNVSGPCPMESEAAVLDLKRKLSFEPLAIKKRIKLVKCDREHIELNNDDKLIHHSENEQLQATLVVNSCGSLVTWGHEDLGGYSLSVADELKSGDTVVFRCALLSDTLDVETNLLSAHDVMGCGVPYYLCTRSAARKSSVGN